MDGVLHIEPGMPKTTGRRLLMQAVAENLQENVLLSMHAYSLPADFDMEAVVMAIADAEIPRVLLVGDSECVAAIGYDRVRQVLEVEFENGGVYRYVGVSLQTAMDMAMAASVGRFYNAHIKGRYLSARIGHVDPRWRIEAAASASREVAA